MQQLRARPLEQRSAVDIRRQIQKLLFTASRELYEAWGLSQPGYVTLADVEYATETAMAACMQIHSLVEELKRRDRAIFAPEDQSPIVMYM